MPALMLLSYGVMLLSGLPLPAEPFVPYLLIPVFIPLFFIAAAFEEVGWMGYAADPLQERRSALETALILGGVWAGWHSIPWLLLNTPAWAAGQAVSTVALRVIIVWLYNNTHGSVFGSRTSAPTTTRSSPGRSRRPSRSPSCSSGARRRLPGGGMATGPPDRNLYSSDCPN